MKQGTEGQACSYLLLVERSQRTVRWARLSAGRKVTPLSSHAGRSDAPDRRQNTQATDTNVGTVMQSQPTGCDRSMRLSRNAVLALES
jgi:hypothetical protein